MTEVETEREREMKEENAGGVEMSVDLEIGTVLVLGGEMRKENAIMAEIQDIIRECVKRRKGIRLGKKNKWHKCSK